MVINPVSDAIIYYEGVRHDEKVAPVEKSSILYNNNNSRRKNEQQKRFIQTPAVVLRISEQRKE
jgi:hypothetical protein